MPQHFQPLVMAAFGLVALAVPHDARAWQPVSSLPPASGVTAPYQPRYGSAPNPSFQPNNTYPPASNPYPRANNAYPQNNGLPAANNAYPPANNAYPPYNAYQPAQAQANPAYRPNSGYRPPQTTPFQPPSNAQSYQPFPSFGPGIQNPGGYPPVQPQFNRPPQFPPNRQPYPQATWPPRRQPDGRQVSASIAQPPTEITSGRVLANVGGEFILEGDIMPQVNQVLSQYQGKIPDSELEKQKDKMVRTLLTQAIESKILYLAFLRSIPADKLAEALPKVRQKVNEEFNKDQLPRAMKKAGVGSAAELDAQLRKFGSSLEKQRRQFFEMKVGRAAIGQNVDVAPEITHQEMLTYYYDHAADYEVKARARWKQISVLYAKNPDRAALLRQIAAMGNEIYLGGSPFEAVAKRGSHDHDAEKGGHKDWITQGSLASTKLDQAIFSFPLNQLSPIIEDDRGYHIVVVTEREPAGRIPFVDAQENIKKELRANKLKEDIRKYVEKIKRETKVDSILDEPPEVQNANRFTTPGRR